MGNLLWDLHTNIERESPGGDRFTLFALNKLKLKKSEKFKVLNLGCGKGLETICLAKNVNGHINAVDAHEPYLEELVKLVEKHGLDDKVTIYLEDMMELPFSKNSFDIIWIEGAIHEVGFENGIKEFRKYLKPNGYLVISDYVYTKPNRPLELARYFEDFYPDINTVDYNTALAEYNNYKVIDSYVLEEGAWWESYFKPLRIRLQELNDIYRMDLIARKTLDSREKEIILREKYKEYFGFAFYILRKNASILTKEKKSKILRKMDEK